MKYTHYLIILQVEFQKNSSRMNLQFLILPPSRENLSHKKTDNCGPIASQLRIEKEHCLLISMSQLKGKIPCSRLSRRVKAEKRK